VHRTNRLIVATGLDAERPAVVTYDPSEDADFPSGFVLSEQAGTRWTEDGTRVLVGLDLQEAEIDDEEEDDQPDVDVWHWADHRLQSVQKVQADADRRFTYSAAYNPPTNALVRLATDDMPRVDVPDRGRWAVGRRDAPYRGILTEDGNRADYVRIDLESGEESLIADDVRRPMGASPDGRWWLFAKDEAVYSVDLNTLEVTNLSAATGLDFIDREFDRITEKPAHGVAGWMERDRVLLNSRWDLWAVPLAGGEPQAFTGAAGERDQVRFRATRLDTESDWVTADNVLLSAYGEWTKKSGYFRPRPGQDPEPLLFEDEMIRDLTKASEADRVVFTRQTFERFPDYWAADSRLRNPERVTDANPQIAEFAWGRRVLVDYVDERGNELQATLALPAGYEEGRRYPMIIYFYEKMSQRHHEFSRPVYDDRPHMSTYASNGYLVLMPDIVYDDGYPGTSALDDVTAAARKAIELGYADPDRIGLQGHSWGGYETSYILTQTDMFAAIVTGAPLTNLMSMNNILYKRTGNQNGPILQWSQGRMGDQPWDDFERWVSQSPVHQAPNISTPFLILHGTEDGAVDWNQGLELYTAARRLGKEVILLSYPGEPHHLTKEANQKDFQVRMKQFFDHYLMDTEAPEWMREGVPFLERNKRQRRAVS
ncbi:MAG: S9 family peptidase, partial [Gemmatimonadetes bacterium]|nr:S9 family peptidase [Gemmatimonadota bacterium]